MALHTPFTRILAYREPVDMRKSFDGLFGLVTSVLDEDPLSPTLFVFFNRRRTLLKALYWDRTGFCLLAKRLEHGRFALQGTDRIQEIDERRLQLLLDGIALGKRASWPSVSSGRWGWGIQFIIRPRTRRWQRTRRLRQGIELMRRASLLRAWLGTGRSR